MDMPLLITRSNVKKLIPVRDPNSHKGQNGRVLIIGGSLAYYGAPILAGLAALHAGSDLVTLLVPECNFEVSRSAAPDFIVRKYLGNAMNTRTIDAAAELIPKADAVLLGPGAGDDPEARRVMIRIAQKTTCPLVLDAEAIPAILEFEITEDPKERAQRIMITPNRAEMEEIFGAPLPKDPAEEQKFVEDFTTRLGVTVLLKKPEALVVGPGRETAINQTGNAGMTVGGSGDVLAGLAAAFVAQRMHAFDAATAAVFLLGKTGDSLFRQKGFHYTATNLALELPFVIHELTSQ